nr:hypothetical protein [uncultured Methanobrevibacter sp.]
MDEQEFNKYKETIENFIIEELILRVPGLINFTIHRLPEILVKDTEYIFFIFDNADESQKNVLEKFLHSQLSSFYDDLGLEYDFIIVLAPY